MSNYGQEFMTCPNCGDKAESDAVDIGVSMIIRGNYSCANCGWKINSENDFGFIEPNELPISPIDVYKDEIND